MGFNVTDKEAIGLPQMAMKEERQFSVVLSESEITLLIGLLWLSESNQLKLARFAERDGWARQAEARRQSAANALRLAERLCEIGAH